MKSQSLWLHGVVAFWCSGVEGHVWWRHQGAVAGWVHEVPGDFLIDGQARADIDRRQGPCGGMLQKVQALQATSAAAAVGFARTPCGSFATVRAVSGKHCGRGAVVISNLEPVTKYCQRYTHKHVPLSCQTLPQLRHRRALPLTRRR